MGPIVEHLAQRLAAAGTGLVVDTSPREVTDFGGLDSAVPLVLARPRDAEAVAHVLVVAGELGLTVTPCGTRHSTSGATLASGGILLDLTSMDRLRSVHAGGFVADGGTPWRSVVTAALAGGQLPAVVTNSLTPTVAGTVSTGGIGVGSHRHGTQADTVTGLEVVTPDGAVRTVDAASGRDLFDAVRAGQGRLAVITKVAAALVPAPRAVRTRLIEYGADFGAFLADLGALAADPLVFGVEGVVLRAEDGADGAAPRCLIELATDAALPAAQTPGAGRGGVLTSEHRPTMDYLTRVADALGPARPPGGEPVRPWCTVLVPAAAAEAVVRTALRAIPPQALPNPVIVGPVGTPAGSAPLLARPAGDVVLVAVFPSVPRDGVARQLAANAEVLACAQAHGGGRYAIDSTPAGDSAGNRAGAGAWPDSAAWRAAKLRYDPAGVLGGPR